MKREKLNCPNCGAPIESTQCPYCGTVFYDFAEMDFDKPTYIRINYNGQYIVFRALARSMNATYLAERVNVELPKEKTKQAYSDFIAKWKPVVKHEDDAMNEPNAWQMQYM